MHGKRFEKIEMLRQKAEEDKLSKTIKVKIKPSKLTEKITAADGAGQDQEDQAEQQHPQDGVHRPGEDPT